MGAHYATFPEELVYRCLRAGTSEKGVCPTCGAQWRRVMGKNRELGWLPGCDCYDLGHIPQPPDKPEDIVEPVFCGDCGGTGNQDLGPLFTEIVACKRCKGSGVEESGNKVYDDWAAENGAAEAERAELLSSIESQKLKTIPALVFDPYSGSGTTLLVARRMGLSGFGIDLNMNYLQKNAKKRIGTSQKGLEI